MWYDSDNMRIVWGSKEKHDAFWAKKKEQRALQNQRCVETLEKQFEEFKQPHLLQKMFQETKHIKGQETSSSHSTSGGFFLLFGGFDSNSNSYARPVNYMTTVVHLAWKNRHGEYCITKISLPKIRVKFSKDVETPTVSFQLTIYLGGMLEEFGTVFYSPSGRVIESHLLRGGSSSLIGCFEHDQQGFFDNNLAYATITCKETDWPQSISFPLDEAHIKELCSA